MKLHTRKQSSTKFTIKLVRVLIFSVATHTEQSASCTAQQTNKSMKTRTHGQPAVSTKHAQRKQRNTKCVNCNCILMQSIKTQPQQTLHAQNNTERTQCIITRLLSKRKSCPLPRFRSDRITPAKTHTTNHKLPEQIRSCETADR
jgi:hypothetical protein